MRPGQRGLFSVEATGWTLGENAVRLHTAPTNAHLSLLQSAQTAFGAHSLPVQLAVKGKLHRG